MKPTIQLHTSSGRQEVSLQALHLGKRRLFLTGSIDDEMADVLIQELLYLAEESQDPIDIYINSPGGSVTSGLAIYDILQTIEAPVNLICIGMAASMAAVLLAGGQKGHRFLYPHSRVMIHAPYLSGGVGGSAGNIQNTATELLRTQRMVNEIVASHSGHTPEEVEKACEYDHYMSAEEAVAFGLCDEILDAGSKVS